VVVQLPRQARDDKPTPLSFRWSEATEKSGQIKRVTRSLTHKGFEMTKNMYTICMHKQINTFLFLVTAFLLVPFISHSYVFAEKIDNYAVKIEIKKDGKIHVREEILYDFEELERHGIFREIPYTKTNTDGKKYKMTIDNISVVDEKKQEYQFSKTDENEQIGLKIGDADRTITGIHTYVISYDVSGALTYFSDHDELYWDAIGTNWNVTISTGSATVVLPQDIKIENIQASCFTGYEQSSESQCRSNIANSTISYFLDRPLSPAEGFTIVSGFPKGMLAVLEPTLIVPFWETFLGKITFGGIMLFALWWYILYPIKIVHKWFTTGRDPHVGPAPTAYFDPPQDKMGRKLAPAETAGLFDEVVDNKDITATYIDLARRGYFTIVEKKKGEFVLIKNDMPAGGLKVKNEELSDFERILFEGTFAGENEVELKKASLVTEFTKTKDKVYERLVSNGFFDKNPDKTRTFYIVMGTLAVTSANPLLALASFIFGRNMPKKTLLGAIEKNKAAGLKNFLQSQERHFAFEKGIKSQELFEKMLPFAVAFGVEKAWVKHFAKTQLANPSWYSGYGHTNTFSGDNFSKSLSSLGSKAASAATPISSSTGHSSGFSGGSSGGGGGGGGGGSW